jgi:phage-related protein
VGFEIGEGTPARAETILEEARRHGRVLEVRAEFGGDAFRLLGFWDAGSLIILTNGFAKKTQKTPSREIALAGQRRRDYLNRKIKR